MRVISASLMPLTSRREQRIAWGDAAARRSPSVRAGLIRSRFLRSGLPALTSGGTGGRPPGRQLRPGKRSAWSGPEDSRNLRAAERPARDWPGGESSAAGSADMTEGGEPPDVDPARAGALAGEPGRWNDVMNRGRPVPSAGGSLRWNEVMDRGRLEPSAGRTPSGELGGEEEAAVVRDDGFSFVGGYGPSGSGVSSEGTVSPRTDIGKYGGSSSRGTFVRAGGPDTVAVFAIRPGRADIGGYGGRRPLGGRSSVRAGLIRSRFLRSGPAARTSGGTGGRPPGRQQPSLLMRR